MSPDDPVQDLLASWRRRLADLQAQTTIELEELLTDATAQLPDPADPDLRVLTGRGQIVAAIRAVAARCTTEQLSMHPRPPRAEALRETEAEDRDALARGIRMRGLVTTAIRSAPPAVTYYRDLSRHGLQMRVSDGLSALTIVVDRRVALVHIGFDAAGEPRALLTESELLVQLLCDLFERTWSLASPLEDSSPPYSGEALSGRQREIFRLCATGMKDDAIARHLGVSTRTVSSEISAAMMSLGARSRFEAGVRWVESSTDLDGHVSDSDNLAT